MMVFCAGDATVGDGEDARANRARGKQNKNTHFSFSPCQEIQIGATWRNESSDLR
jgi:hypothetical protein